MMTDCDEAPTARLITSQRLTARLPHPCVCCDTLIRPGERHRRDVWLVDGVIEACQSHLGCPEVEEERPYEEPFPEDWEVSDED